MIRNAVVLVLASSCSAVLAGDIFPLTGYSAREPYRKLSQPDVREALEVTDEQMQQARRLNLQIQQMMLAASREARERGLHKEELQKFTVAKMDEQSAKLDEALKVILSPRQYKRLQQLAYHKSMPGQLWVVTMPHFLRQLQLSEDEAVAWGKVVKREHEAYGVAINEAYKSRHSLVGDFLTEEQHRIYATKFGEKMKRTAPRLAARGETYYALVPALQLILDDVEVTYDLEATDNQKEQLAEMRTRWADELKQWPVGQLSTGSLPDDRLPTVADLNRRFLAQLPEILLPHQIKRLDQLVMRARARTESGELMRTELFAETLKMSKTQRARLLKAMDERDRATKKDRVELARQTMKRIVEALTEEQQVRYHRLVGPPPRESQSPPIPR